MMKCLRSFKSVLFVVCSVLVFSLVQAQEQQEHLQPHAHLQIKAAIPAAYLGSKGDVLGIYAVEMIPCTKDKTKAKDMAYLEEGKNLQPNILQAVLETTTDLFVSSAWANHRQKFDGPASKEVKQRLSLDQSQDVDIGNLPIALGTYCKVRLILARLPAVTQPVSLPALPFSFRMARPGTLPALELNYSHPFIIGLKAPWVAKEGSTSKLNITLYPSLAQPLLADAKLDEGTLSQKVLTLLAERAKAVVKVNKK